MAAHARRPAPEAPVAATYSCRVWGNPEGWALMDDKASHQRCQAGSPLGAVQT